MPNKPVMLLTKEVMAAATEGLEEFIREHVTNDAPTVTEMIKVLNDGEYVTRTPIGQYIISTDKWDKSYCSRDIAVGISYKEQRINQGLTALFARLFPNFIRVEEEG